MLIVCPSCATSYDVELASLGPLGRQVRCSRCRTVWRAAPAHADKLLAAAEAIAPAPVAEPVLEDAGAAPLHEPAVEAPTEEVSELRRRIAAMDEPEGEERRRQRAKRSTRRPPSMRTRRQPKAPLCPMSRLKPPR